ncbi:hypothetical protein JCM10207_000322 [Rhodosporidiobolus poonsookiae]
MAHPRPPKRSKPSPSSVHAPAPPAHLDPALDPATSLASTAPTTNPSLPGAAQRPSPLIHDADKLKLRVVVQALAPPPVLEQHLSVPGSEGLTLDGVLAPDAQPVSVAVLRAALNDASTAALLSSTMMVFDDAGSAASARLLNQIDDFQRTVGGVLDDLERRYDAAEQGEEGEGKRGVKREAEVDADGETDTPSAPAPPPTKMRKYMLHRALATGVDLFTSAAILSEADLEELAQVPDTDLIAVHPPSATTSSLSSVPAPSLGSLSPAPPLPLFAPSVPALARFNLAPGQPSATAAAAAEGVEMLYYGPTSSFAPAFDSARAAGTGATYAASARRALADARTRRWEAALTSPAPPPAASSLPSAPAGPALDTATRELLAEMGVDASQVEQAAREADLWAELRSVGEALRRVGGMQVARVRSAAAAKGKEEGVKTEGEDEGVGAKAGERERAEATALLSSLTALLSRHRSTPASRILPPPQALARLAPLILASLPSAREPSYTGALDEVNHRAVREGQVGMGVKIEGGSVEGALGAMGQ